MSSFVYTGNMNTQQQWNLATELARKIVEATKREFGGVDALAFDFGGSSSKSRQNTAFQRKGTSTTDRSYALPSDLSALIKQGYTTGAPDPSVSSSESSFLLNLLSRDQGGVPGLSTLEAIRGISPTAFSGTNELNAMKLRNPYSSDYESAVGNLFDRQFATARSLAQSGPGNVRGGTARQGFELAELGAQNAMNKFREVRGQQDREAGVVQNAIQLLNTIESLRRGTQLQAQNQQMSGEAERTREGLGGSDATSRLRTNNLAHLQLAGELLGRPKQVTTDDLTGRGTQAQNTSSTNWGVNVLGGCCFIMAEALNGYLPWYVYAGQREFVTPKRRVGYKWMANWLVPKMRNSTRVRKIVNVFMVKPFLVFGKWYYEGKKGFGGCMWPVCWTWLKVWGTLGRMLYGKYS